MWGGVQVVGLEMSAYMDSGHPTYLPRQQASGVRRATKLAGLRLHGSQERTGGGIAIVRGRVCCFGRDREGSYISSS